MERVEEKRMKMRSMFVLGGVVLLGASLAMAGNLMPGTGLGGGLVLPPQLSSCTGDFGNNGGVCNIFEGPDNPEQQDFNLGTPNVVTGLGDILDADGVTLSDSLLWYMNADGNVHLLFQSDQFAQGGGAVIAFEDAAGNWSYNVGNVYQGNSPIPEPSELMLLGSGIVGIAGVVRRRFM